MILEALNTGMGINAACRVFKVSKNTLYSWLDRIGSLKETLLLYALCPQFLVHLIEGEEVYTRVHENKPPEESEGWTVGLMSERPGSSGSVAVEKRPRVCLKRPSGR